MTSTVTITELQAAAPKIVRRAEKNGSVSVSRHGRTVAFLVSRERMEAILETLEISADRNAMKTVRQYESGKLVMTEFSVDEI
jgi:prevent-host-death family protein